jgi:acyl-CoA oxidase
VAEKSALRELIGRLTDDLVPGREGEEDLLDREYHKNLFLWREEHILSGAARRLKRGIDDGRDAFDVFNECQDHVLSAARAHTEREIHEAFVGAVERTEDKGLKEVLGILCDLHALTEIERDRAWFQEHGRISSTRAKAITRQVNDLLTRVRPRAVDLVDAFGIPDELLAAPIGLPGGKASQTSSAEIEKNLPNVRELIRELGEELGDQAPELSSA